MGFYGRNFDFAIPPRAEARGGRFLAPSTPGSGTGNQGGTAAFSGGPGQITLPAGLLPMGAPVVWNGAAPDAYGRLGVQLPTAGAAPTGIFGVVYYEYGPAWSAGFDIYITTYADMGFIPLGAPVIVVKGDPATKIVLKNTAPTQFLGITNYPGRIMVAGLGTGATPSGAVAVGNYLVPGVGNDTDGYWEAQTSSAGAWAVITYIDDAGASLEAQLLF